MVLWEALQIHMYSVRFGHIQFPTGNCSAVITVHCLSIALIPLNCLLHTPYVNTAWYLQVVRIGWLQLSCRSHPVSTRRNSSLSQLFEKLNVSEHLWYVQYISRLPIGHMWLFRLLRDPWLAAVVKVNHCDWFITCTAWFGCNFVVMQVDCCRYVCTCVHMYVWMCLELSSCSALCLLVPLCIWSF